MRVLFPYTPCKSPGHVVSILKYKSTRRLSILWKSKSQFCKKYHFICQLHGTACVNCAFKLWPFNRVILQYSLCVYSARKPQRSQGSTSWCIMKNIRKHLEDSKIKELTVRSFMEHPWLPWVHCSLIASTYSIV